MSTTVKPTSPNGRSTNGTVSLAGHAGLGGCTDAEALLAQRQQRLKLAETALNDAVAAYTDAVSLSSPFHPKWLLEPPVQRAAYSDRTAWVMARMALMAYQPFERAQGLRAKLEADLISGGFRLLRTFTEEKTDTQAFLAAFPATEDAWGYRVLAFRGTQPDVRSDWATDLRFMFKSWQGESRVHGGFRTAWFAVRDAVSSAVAELEPQLPLYVTGHSLGGALAVLATYDLPDDELAACYTFGCPRVGDIDFNASRKTPTYQVINACDLVPRVPFSLQNFMHTGDIRYLDYSGRLLTDSSRFGRTGRWLLDSFRTWVSQRRSAWIGDHSMERYIAKLEAFAIERNQSERMPAL